MYLNVFDFLAAYLDSFGLLWRFLLFLVEKSLALDKRGEVFIEEAFFRKDSVS